MKLDYYYIEKLGSLPDLTFAERFETDWPALAFIINKRYYFQEAHNKPLRAANQNNIECLLEDNFIHEYQINCGTFEFKEGFVDDAHQLWKNFRPTLRRYVKLALTGDTI